MGLKRIGSLGITIVLVGLGLLTNAWAGVWDMDPPLPNNDPQWEQVRALWTKHYDGDYLDELIAALAPLKEKNPERVEPYLWLARAHYLHARYHRKDRPAH